MHSMGRHHLWFAQSLQLQVQGIRFSLLKSRRLNSVAVVSVKALIPIWEKAATVLNGVATVAALDADARQALAQIKALLKERLNGKTSGGSSEKSEPSASVELKSGNFYELVLKRKELWIVDFFDPRCGNGKRLALSGKKLLLT
ncbi:hypothetical protein L6164_031491 [Bauhinia variegata]|uniref:Uncharacterized protein n=1 Tax=Bauhinia variegata TaxID=167791 RepID=A0ACB9LG28_BAUVA|nr:hypothetical protein L6164_031491 [Bauhinia variegata]